MRTTSDAFLLVPFGSVVLAAWLVAYGPNAVAQEIGAAATKPAVEKRESPTPDAAGMKSKAAAFTPYPPGPLTMTDQQLREWLMRRGAYCNMPPFRDLMLSGHVIPKTQAGDVSATGGSALSGKPPQTCYLDLPTKIGTFGNSFLVLNASPRDMEELPRTIEALPNFPEITNIQLMIGDAVDPKNPHAPPEMPPQAIALLKTVAALPNLHSLVISNGTLTDQVVATLVPSRSLRYMMVQRCRLTEKGLDELSKLKNLEHLTVGTGLKPDCFTTLAKLPRFRRLYLFGPTKDFDVPIDEATRLAIASCDGRLEEFQVMDRGTTLHGSLVNALLQLKSMRILRVTQVIPEGLTPEQRKEMENLREKAGANAACLHLVSPTKRSVSVVPPQDPRDAAIRMTQEECDAFLRRRAGYANLAWYVALNRIHWVAKSPAASSNAPGELRLQPQDFYIEFPKGYMQFSKRTLVIDLEQDKAQLSRIAEALPLFPQVDVVFVMNTRPEIPGLATTRYPYERMPIPATLLKALAAMPNLRKLSFCGGNFSKEAAEAVASSRSIRELGLGKCKITQEAFAKLAELKTLESLSVMSGLEPDCFVTLAKLPRFRRFRLLGLTEEFNQPIDDAVRRAIASLDGRLEEFSVEEPDVPVHDSLVAALSKVKSLKTLKIAAAGVAEKTDTRVATAKPTVSKADKTDAKSEQRKGIVLKMTEEQMRVWLQKRESMRQVPELQDSPRWLLRFQKPGTPSDAPDEEDVWRVRKPNFLIEMDQDYVVLAGRTCRITLDSAGEAKLPQTLGLLPYFPEIDQVQVKYSSVSIEPSYQNTAHENKPISLELLHALAKLPCLESLGIEGGTFSDEAMGVLASCRSLRYLSLGRCRISEAGFAKLASLKNLESLSVVNTFRPNDFLTLAELPRFRSLRVKEALHPDFNRPLEETVRRAIASLDGRLDAFYVDGRVPGTLAGAILKLKSLKVWEAGPIEGGLPLADIRDLRTRSVRLRLPLLRETMAELGGDAEEVYAILENANTRAERRLLEAKRAEPAK